MNKKLSSYLTFNLVSIVMQWSEFQEIQEDHNHNSPIPKDSARDFICLWPYLEPFFYGLFSCYHSMDCHFYFLPVLVLASGLVTGDYMV